MSIFFFGLNMAIEILENKDLLITDNDFDKFVLGQLYPNGFEAETNDQVTKILKEVLTSIGLYCRGFDGEKISITSSLKKVFLSLKEDKFYYNIIFGSLESAEKVMISVTYNKFVGAIPMLNGLIKILYEHTKLERVKNNKKPNIEKVLPFNVNRLRHNFNCVFSEHFESKELFNGYSYSPSHKNRIHIGHSIALKDNSTGVAILTTVDFN